MHESYALYEAQMILFATKFLLLRAILEHATSDTLDPQLIDACQRLCHELRNTVKKLEKLRIDINDNPTTRACFGCPSGSFNFKGWVNAIKHLYEAIYLAFTRPPGVTYITPDEVAAGYTITTPGSYLLTGPASYAGSSGTSAITIASDGVTLDLGGYRITKASGSLNGIHTTNRSHITIRNGILNLFSFAVDIEGTNNITLENLTFIYCGSGVDGFSSPTTLAFVKNCTFQENEFYDYQVIGKETIVEASHVKESQGFNVLIASDATSTVVKDCSAVNCMGTGFTCSIQGATSKEAGTLIMGCYASDNTSHGFYGTPTNIDPSLVNNHADGNDAGSTTPQNYDGFSAVPPGVGHHFETANAYSWEFWESLDLP